MKLANSIVWLLFATTVSTSKIVSVNKLLKAFCHKSPDCDKIVFYFLQKPDLQQPLNGSFFIPCSLANQESKQMVSKIKKIRRPWYELKTNVLTGKSGGVQLNLQPAHAQVKQDHAFFTAIGGQQAIVFMIHDEQQETKKQRKKRAVVVIDCGHGGQDHGAIGCNGLREKDVTRAVGQSVVRLLRSRGVIVKLTRAGDQTVALDERTTRANYISGVDLFVSLHGNSSPSNGASGIETYCTDQNLFHTQPKGSASFCSAISCDAAKIVHKQIMQSLVRYNKPLIDRKVKRAVSQVLLGSRAPAILIELGFVTNKKESARLQDKSYQCQQAQGIVDGIVSYLTKQGYSFA